MDSLGLHIYMANNFDFKRKEQFGDGYSVLYGFIEDGVKFSILIEYANKDVLRDFVIRGKLGDAAFNFRIENRLILNDKVPIKVLVDEAVKRIKLKLNSA